MRPSTSSSNDDDEDSPGQDTLLLLSHLYDRLNITTHGSLNIPVEQLYQTQKCTLESIRDILLCQIDEHLLRPIKKEVLDLTLSILDQDASNDETLQQYAQNLIWKRNKWALRLVISILEFYPSFSVGHTIELYGRIECITIKIITEHLRPDGRSPAHLVKLAAIALSLILPVHRSPSIALDSLIGGIIFPFLSKFDQRLESIMGDGREAISSTTNSSVIQNTNALSRQEYGSKTIDKFKSAQNAVKQSLVEMLAKLEDDNELQQIEILFNMAIRNHLNDPVAAEVAAETMFKLTYSVRAVKSQLRLTEGFLRTSLVPTLQTSHNYLKASIMSIITKWADCKEINECDIEILQPAIAVALESLESLDDIQEVKDVVNKFLAIALQKAYDITISIIEPRHITMIVDKVSELNEDIISRLMQVIEYGSAVLHDDTDNEDLRHYLENPAALLARNESLHQKLISLERLLDLRIAATTHIEDRREDLVKIFEFIVNSEDTSPNLKEKAVTLVKLMAKSSVDNTLWRCIGEIINIFEITIRLFDIDSSGMLSETSNVLETFVISDPETFFTDEIRFQHLVDVIGVGFGINSVARIVIRLVKAILIQYKESYTATNCLAQIIILIVSQLNLSCDDLEIHRELMFCILAAFATNETLTRSVVGSELQGHKDPLLEMMKTSVDSFLTAFNQREVVGPNRRFSLSQSRLLMPTLTLSTPTSSPGPSRRATPLRPQPKRTPKSNKKQKTDGHTSQGSTGLSSQQLDPNLATIENTILMARLVVQVMSSDDQKSIRELKRKFVPALIIAFETMMDFLKRRSDTRLGPLFYRDVCAETVVNLVRANTHSSEGLLGPFTLGQNSRLEECFREVERHYRGFYPGAIFSRFGDATVGNFWVGMSWDFSLYHLSGSNINPLCEGETPPATQ